jgi:hypothetical protein
MTGHDVTLTRWEATLVGDAVVGILKAVLNPTCPHPHGPPAPTAAPSSPPANPATSANSATNAA